MSEPKVLCVACPRCPAAFQCLLSAHHVITPELVASRVLPCMVVTDVAPGHCGGRIDLILLQEIFQSLALFV